MDKEHPQLLTAQGFGHTTSERLPIPERNTMSDAQRAAADAIINGPRKAIFGPFVPLLQTPALMERIGKTGEALRFDGTLPERIRELAICVVARETGNQFEWQTHSPLAMKAGVLSAAIDALAVGRRPRELATDEACAFDFVMELMRRNGVSDETYAEAATSFGYEGTVELTALVGYFVMVCWIMNVGRTPGPGESVASGVRRVNWTSWTRTTARRRIRSRPKGSGCRRSDSRGLRRVVSRSRYPPRGRARLRGTSRRSVEWACA
jgi:4-carboxymuconolactone decarboxylase